MLKFIASKFIANPYFFSVFDNIVKQKALKNSYEQITNHGSTFYPEAKVSNHANNPALINVGSGSHIRGHLLVFNYGGKISIGDNCYVGENSNIWSGESITIGNDVLISHDVNIMDTNSHEIDSVERSERYKDLLKNGHWKDKGSIKTKGIIIEDSAWISFRVIILKGVRIGKGAVIGAGSVVTKNVPDYTIVAGNPAVEIGKAT